MELMRSKKPGWTSSFQLGMLLPMGRRSSTLHPRKSFRSLMGMVEQNPMDPTKKRSRMDRLTAQTQRLGLRTMNRPKSTLQQRRIHRMLGGAMRERGA